MLWILFNGNFRKPKKKRIKTPEIQLLLIEMMGLRQGVKEIAGMFLFSSSFILASELFRITLLWLKRVQIQKPGDQQKMWNWGFRINVDLKLWWALFLSLPFACEIMSMAGTWEGTAESDDSGFFDLKAGFSWKGQMLRLGVSVWCLSEALRENPFLISLFPAEAGELNSAWSQRGKGNNAKFLPDFWASSLPVAKKWQKVLSPGYWKGKGIPAFGKGGL